LEGSQQCHVEPCPVDCVSHWGTYGPCSNACAPGNQTRHKVVTVNAQHGGKPCGPLTSMKYCDPLCPVDCTVSDWGNFSPCSNSCGNGFRIRTRTIQKMLKTVGKPVQNSWTRSLAWTSIAQFTVTWEVGTDGARAAKNVAVVPELIHVA
jgi:hypothetical protein